MTDQEINAMQNADNKDFQAAVESAVEKSAPDEQSAAGREQKESYRGSREASYGILFIAAVFVINAMEKASYRTPWPVAIVVSLIGLGLYGYSWLLQSKKNN